jgi:hypothetical protein
MIGVRPLRRIYTPYYRLLGKHAQACLIGSERGIDSL